MVGVNEGKVEKDLSLLTWEFLDGYYFRSRQWTAIHYSEQFNDFAKED